MSKIWITCGLAVIVLGAASLIWAVQNGSASDAGAQQPEAGTTPQDTGAADLEDTDQTKGGHGLLELTKGLDGFRMPCKDCHKGLGSPVKDPIERGVGLHKQVTLQHGDNNRCFNCHHPDSDQYGSFVDHDGSVIPLEHVERLCAKCHGPHYRDWKHGSHGLRTGYWNTELGPQTTASCISCHDPHQPYFKPIPTLPGPRSFDGTPLPDHPCFERN